MTKERKLAIELWQAMREKVSNGEIKLGYEMYSAKQCWLEEHSIDWYNGCWFCHYLRIEREDNTSYEGKTAKCPLNRYRPSRCEGRCRMYTVACNRHYSIQQRLTAIDNIIKALKGEYKEEENENENNN